jgi:hypothetical protein
VSDAATPEVPRLILQESDSVHLPEIIRELRDEVLRGFDQHANATPERVMELVAKRWMESRQGPFMILLTYWSANAFQAPDIWQEPTTSCDGETTTSPVFTKSWRLKWLQEIDLMIGDFGSGDGFYFCLEPSDVFSEAEYEHLRDLFEQRDEQLAATSHAS